MTTRRASLRRHVRIARPADEVWAIVGDPARITDWFPGIVAADVDGETRTITTGAGLPMPERIITCDRLQRRFQYTITAPLFREHLSTIDVIDLDDGSSLVVYGVDAAPATMALVIAGAAGNALEHLRFVLEGAG